MLSVHRGSMFLLISTCLGVVAGCTSLPIPRGATGPATPTPGATIDRPKTALPVPARLDMTVYDEPRDEPGVLPALPAEEVPQAPAVPTPLLDEALVKAKATQLMVIEEVSIPANEVESPTIEPKPEVVAETPPKVIEPPKPPPTPAEIWHDSLESLRNLARQRPDMAPPTTWSVRAAFVEWLAKVGADPEADRLSTTLMATLPTETADPASRADRIREAVAALEDRAPLEISEIQFCRKVHGFGDFENLSLESIKPGQAVILYWEVNGLRHEAVEGGYRTRLAAQVEIVSQAGGPAVLTQTLNPVEDRCRRRRRDYYVNSRVDLPASLAPGAYELRLTQTDTIANKSSSRTLVFSVKP